MFLENERFPFIQKLENAWEKIRAEAMALPAGNYNPWGETHLYDQVNGWDVFVFTAAKQPIVRNQRLCPETTRVLSQVPDLITAGFSVLKPGTHITPHEGFSTPVLRCHLGLTIPPGCRFRVKSETRHWEEGKCWIFNDGDEHEAWNDSKEIRIILIVDVVKPGKTITDAEITKMVEGFKAGGVKF
jgi:beta-hydroxylase